MTELFHSVTVGNVTIPGNLFLAPVAGYSDRPFRSLCTEWGASCCFTEMISSEALVRASGKTELLLARAPNERYLGIQLFGGVPETMARAARMVADLQPTETQLQQFIDINAGCPVPKIVKTGAGSSLTRDPDRLYALVKAVVAAVPELGITVKIRSGWDEKTLTWREAAEAALQAGARMITLHPRTKTQGYEGKSDWTLLRQLTDMIHKNYLGIPVFGSGDLFTPQDAERMITETGVDGVMFARGAMGNPFIFTMTRNLLTEGNCGAEIPPQKRMQAAFSELQMLVRDIGEEIACREMRKRFCAYSKGIRGGAELRNSFVKSSSVADYKAILTAEQLLP